MEQQLADVFGQCTNLQGVPEAKPGWDGREALYVRPSLLGYLQHQQQNPALGQTTK